jgi:O-antigen/teichoic acid export membrane protein
LAVNVISNRLTNRELRLSTADQVTSSLSNLVFIVLIAQSSSSEVFAQISTIWTIVSFSVVISRSVFGVPLLLDGNLFSTNNYPSISGARSGALLLGLPALLASVGLFVFAQGDSGLPFLILAACVPLILLQDFGRYLAIASGGSKDALVSDLILLAPLAIGSLLVVSNLLSINAIAASGILLSGLILSMFTLRKYEVLKLSIGSFRSLVSNDIARRKKLLQEALLNAFTAVASVAAVWIAYESNSVAAFNGALYILAPITLALLVVNLVIQQSVSQSKGIVHKREYSIFGALLLAAFLWTLIVANLPEALGLALLGVTWSLVQPIVIPMAAVLTLSLVLEFVLMVFRARGQFSLIVSIRILVSIASPCVYVIAGLTGYSLGLALYIVAATLSILVAGLYIRSKSYFLS